jgi:hypothetical protein
MVTKRGARVTKRAKKVKDLGVTHAKAGKTKGGSPKWIEIKDFSYGASNPTTTGSGTSDREGKVPSVSQIIVK